MRNLRTSKISKESKPRITGKLELKLQTCYGSSDTTKVILGKLFKVITGA